MIDLKTIQPSVDFRPPKLIIYGPSGIGKSTFASQAPNPIVLDLEGGMDLLNLPKYKIKPYNESKSKPFEQIMDLLRALYQQNHNYQYLIIDSLDWLERIMINHLCDQNNAKTLNDRNCKAFAYGAGERLLLNIWDQFIAGLDFVHQERQMGIILTAHSHIKKFDDPLTESYDQHNIKLEKKCGERIKEWVECILFANLKVKIEEEKLGFNQTINRGKPVGRILCTERRPAFEAKNRYKLPPEIELSWKSFIGHVEKCHGLLKEKQSPSKKEWKEVSYTNSQSPLTYQQKRPLEQQERILTLLNGDDVRLNAILKWANIDSLCEMDDESYEITIERLESQDIENNILKEAS